MNSSQQQQHQQQQQQQQYMQHQEREQKRVQEELSKHLQRYPIDLIFPAKVYSNNNDSSSKSSTTKTDNDGGLESNYLSSSSSTRTCHDFINFKLLETGLRFHNDHTDVDDNDNSNVDGDNDSNNEKKTKVQTLNEVTQRLGQLANNLEKTGCYDSVQVVLGRATEEEEGQDQNTTPLRQIDVLLHEKKWYKLYIGGGIKHDTGLSNSGAAATSSLTGVPKLQFETTASLLNITGHCDVTTASYTVDQTSTPTFTLLHSRPLYSLFSPTGRLRNFVLDALGTEYTFAARGEVDTLDYEHVRSCKDHFQLVGFRISNTPHGSLSSNAHPPSATEYRPPHQAWDWTLKHIDTLPRRSPTLPYTCDASPEIISFCGTQSPTLKHSVAYEMKMNGSGVDDVFNPTVGLDGGVGIEIAGPPGDVGFLKLWGGGSLHVPLFGEDGIFHDSSNGQTVPKKGWLGELWNGLSFHAAWNGGLLCPLTYGGLCTGGVSVDGQSVSTHLSDRFYVGGSHQLRGFLPSGIGPRASTGGANTPGGDAMGGDVYYTTTACASVPFAGDNFLSKSGVRLFGFVNAGTLTGLNHAMHVGSFLKSTRVAVGGGVSVGTTMGRLEATYAVPIRYGPRDARRHVQAGLGFTFG